MRWIYICGYTPPRLPGARESYISKHRAPSAAIASLHNILDRVERGSLKHVEIEIRAGDTPLTPDASRAILAAVISNRYGLTMLDPEAMLQQAIDKVGQDAVNALL